MAADGSCLVFEVDCFTCCFIKAESAVRKSVSLVPDWFELNGASDTEPV